MSNGTTLTFTAAPSSNSGNNIFVYYLFRTVGTVSHPSNNALQASDITVDTTTLVTDSTNNRVGIGTASPAVALETSGDMAVSDTSTASKRLQLSAGASEHTINSANYGSDMMDLNIQAENTIFKNGLIGVAERARIDSNGVLMVATTDDDPVFNNANGASIGSNNGSALAGVGQFSCSGGVAVRANRSNEEGAVIGIHSEGTQEGIIGIKDAQPFMSNNGGTNNCGIRIANNALIPCNNIGAVSDDNVDLGAGDARYDDVFATNTSISTSDKNEKQDIEELSEAEKKVAVACKSLLRKYKWKKAVTEKSDKARIHFGIIAQDLEDAFKAEGLDASKYAMFCSDTWTDIDGKEQTRLGVRYSELLAFIISAI